MWQSRRREQSQDGVLMRVSETVTKISHDAKPSVLFFLPKFNIEPQ